MAPPRHAYLTSHPRGKRELQRWWDHKQKRENYHKNPYFRVVPTSQVSMYITQINPWKTRYIQNWAGQKFCGFRLCWSLPKFLPTSFHLLWILPTFWLLLTDQLARRGKDRRRVAMPSVHKLVIYYLIFLIVLSFFSFFRRLSCQK